VIPPLRRGGLLLLAALLLLGARRPPLNYRPVELVLRGAAGGERSVQTRDFRFAWFERIYYQRGAPREEDPSGRRLEVEDRRHECLCLRLADGGKLKFNTLRQIEIVGGEGAVASVRITTRPGEVREYPIEALAGGAGSLPPRFVGSIDGAAREFHLTASESDPAQERLVRVLLLRKPPPPPPRRRR
jgi:hypothetical protein